MAKQKEKIYRRRRPVRALLRVLGILALVAAIAFVVVFFWFQNFIVYTPDGIRLDIPFWRDILDEIPEDATSEPIPLPVASPPPIPSDPGDEPEAPIQVEDFRTVFLSGADLPHILWELALADFDGVLVAMNDSSGRLWWDTDVVYAHSFELAGTGDPVPYLEQMGEDTRRSALLYGFQNSLMATRNPPIALTDDFLDPETIYARDYLTDLALELVRLGFNEIVLTGFAYPPDYQSAETDQLLLDFFTSLANILRISGASLSIMTAEADWVDAYGDPVLFHPSFANLVPIVDRFYCLLRPETTPDSPEFAALQAAVEAALGQEIHRFVPGAPGSRPDEGNWIVIPQAGELFG